MTGAAIGLLISRMEDSRGKRWNGSWSAELQKWATPLRRGRLVQPKSLAGVGGVVEGLSLGEKKKNCLPEGTARAARGARGAK